METGRKRKAAEEGMLEPERRSGCRSKKSRDYDEMAVGARSLEEDPLALSLSLSQPSGYGFVSTDLSLLHSATRISPAPASTKFELHVSDLRLPVQTLDMETPPVPPLQSPSPTHNQLLHLATRQNILPPHPIMAGVSTATNMSHFAPQPSCRSFSSFRIYPTQKQPVPFNSGVSSIPLSLSFQQQLPPEPSPSTEQKRPTPRLRVSFPPRRSARIPRHTLAEGKHERIEPPYRWATDRRATVYPLERLLDMGITVIHGEVQCRKCEYVTLMEYDLQSKFTELVSLIAENVHAMHNCALDQWLNPTFPPCSSCQTPNCMRPLMALKKRNINWLFMLLGQTIGTCKLEQLKYFCKHTRQHRTGAKNRLLFSIYIAICQQLNPDGPFEEQW